LDRVWLRIEYCVVLSVTFLWLVIGPLKMAGCQFTHQMFSACPLRARHCAGAEGTQRNKTTFLPEKRESFGTEARELFF